MLQHWCRGCCGLYGRALPPAAANCWCSLSCTADDAGGEQNGWGSHLCCCSAMVQGWRCLVASCEVSAALLQWLLASGGSTVLHGSRAAHSLCGSSGSTPGDPGQPGWGIGEEWMRLKPVWQQQHVAWPALPGGSVRDVCVPAAGHCSRQPLFGQCS
jgi:hypothetical protein